MFKEATSFELRLKVLHFQKQPFKQLQYFEKKNYRQVLATLWTICIFWTNSALLSEAAVPR